MNCYYKCRNSIIHFFYTRLLKPILFLFDPEDIHNLFLKVGSFLGRFGLTRWKTKILFGYKNPKLSQKVLGINFENPIGLSAGFDKDIVLTNIISSVGFGFEEVGSVTAKAYEGNPRPRLWRLPKTKSLGVWFGLKTKGAKVLSKELSQKIRRLPIGVNIAFTNCKENLDISSAIPDYVSGFMMMEKYADYLTINLSCPNTSGGMPFLVPENYEKLMIEIDKIPTRKPIFVKISPDMSHEDIDMFLEISAKHRMHGIICSNLTKKFDISKIKDPIPPHGGLSGKLVFPKALDLLSYMYKKVGNKYIFIFCGGIFSANDAYKVIRQGATLMELITGMIFEGPQVISEINRGLVERLTRDGFKNISEAIGIDNQ
ncbi:MAG: quinone-dependent dihydroorotate dehydrogenase [Candidatus Zambryskibacteria bacterium]|nr:quinone-dependent dihydroorotate dehydrogenase [Candidatus Zambryskibacteria bacterium]